MKAAKIIATILLILASVIVLRYNRPKIKRWIDRLSESVVNEIRHNIGESIECQRRDAENEVPSHSSKEKVYDTPASRLGDPVNPFDEDANEDGEDDDAWE